MNLRDAAAVASMVWYLIVPPGSFNNPDVKASFSKWQKLSSFETVQDCERQLSREQVEHGEIPSAKHVHPLLNIRLLAGQCVAANDPRLKGR
jgi:hypothetical protein